ncbi:unknown [Bacteroides sp. CAG:633]|nr:unknown [Bacteroides sp. CAG:633]
MKMSMDTVLKITKTQKAAPKNQISTFLRVNIPTIEKTYFKFAIQTFSLN